MKRFLIAALGLALSAQTAQAQLFTDNFNAEGGGNSALNYKTFANWNVTGQVDLVKSGDFGISCFGSCVDLDGSSGPGSITTKSAYAFNSGDVMTFSFGVSGNQRFGAADNFYLRLLFGQVVPVSSYSATGGFGVSGGSPGTLGPTFTLTRANLPSTEPFSTWTFSFLAAGSGSVAYELGTTSADNVGPIVDNISITRSSTTTVPEPSTWALMAAGLGAMALVARRRTRA